MHKTPIWYDTVMNQPPAVTKISWTESIWFADIDDTLIDTVSASIPASEGIRQAEAEQGRPIDYAKAIMLGDSFAGDLQTPKEKLHFGLVVLRENNRHQTQVDDAHQITVGNLMDITQHLA